MSAGGQTKKDDKPPFPWGGMGRIAVVCLLPWLILGALAANREGVPVATLTSYGGLGLIGMLAIFAVLAYAIYRYEIFFFEWVALPIVDDRRKPQYDCLQYGRLVNGISHSGEDKRASAERLFNAMGDAIDNLTSTPWRGRKMLAAAVDTPEKVIAAIAAVPGFEALDRKGLFDRLTQAVNHIQSSIDGEYAAIASRVGWVLASQAFLLTAFVAIVNADRLEPETQFWLAVSVAFTAAVMSFVLLLASMFGHALVERLKKDRDTLEEQLHDAFGLRRRGVPLGAAVHVLGHSATRYVPCVGYIAWVSLALAAMCNVFTLQATPRTVLLGPARLSQGWVKYPEVSPSFRPRAIVYPDAPELLADKGAGESGCPTKNDADLWIKKVAAAWKARPEAGANDALLLVGGADRSRLGSDLQKQIDANVALARGRAETVKKLLQAETARENPLHLLSPDRILITVTGPRIGVESSKAPASITDCSNGELARDRTVEVWLPGPLAHAGK